MDPSPHQNFLGSESVHNQNGNVKNHLVSLIHSSFTIIFLSFLFFYSHCYQPVGFHAFGLSFLSACPALHCCSSWKNYCGHITTQLKNLNDSPVPQANTQQPFTTDTLPPPLYLQLFFYANSSQIDVLSYSLRDAWYTFLPLYCFYSISLPRISFPLVCTF